MESTEMFTYMGKSGKVHFFLHYQANEMQIDKIVTMSADIYNVMISEGMIKNQDKVVVYNIISAIKIVNEPSLMLGVTGTIKNVKLLAVETDHVSFTHLVYDTKDLAQMFINLIKAERKIHDSLFIIKAFIENGKAVKYFNYDVPSTIEILQSIKSFDFPVEYVNTYLEFERCLTSKPL